MPNAKVLEQNKQKVADVAECLKTSAAGVFVDYRGLTVEEDTQLRVELRKAGVEYKVIKNTLLDFASKEVGLEELEPTFHGPTALATHPTDLIAPAKVLSEFAKKHKVMEIKSGFIEGKPVNASEVSALADLPSKEELIAKTLRGFNAPISGFVNVLNGNIRGLVCALSAIAEKQQ